MRVGVEIRLREWGGTKPELGGSFVEAAPAEEARAVRHVERAELRRDDLRHDQAELGDIGSGHVDGVGRGARGDDACTQLADEVSGERAHLVRAGPGWTRVEERRGARTPLVGVVADVIL